MPKCVQLPAEATRGCQGLGTELEEEKVSLTLFYFILLFYVYKCLPVHHVGVWYLQRPEEGARSPGTRVTYRSL